MSQIRHYRVLPRAMGPLTLLEGIAEVPDGLTSKSLNLQIRLVSANFDWDNSGMIYVASRVSSDCSLVQYIISYT